MKTLYASTALALVLGLGAAGMNAAPAHAADAIVVAQAEGGGAGGAGGGAGGAGGDQGDDSGAQHPLEEAGARPENVLQCDVDGDGFVTVDESRACYEEHFGTISGGGSHLTMEQFTGAVPEAESDPTLFEQLDTDGDGQVSRDEWLEWRGAGFAEAAPEGRMSVEDYERWQSGGASD